MVDEAPNDSPCVPYTCPTEREQWRADEITIDRIERQQYEAAQPTSWAQAAEGLDIPQREHSREMEMER